MKQEIIGERKSPLTRNPLHPFDLEYFVEPIIRDLRLIEAPLPRHHLLKLDAQACGLEPECHLVYGLSHVSGTPTVGANLTDLCRLSASKNLALEFSIASTNRIFVRGLKRRAGFCYALIVEVASWANPDSVLTSQEWVQRFLHARFKSWQSDIPMAGDLMASQACFATETRLMMRRS